MTKDLIVPLSTVPPPAPPVATPLPPPSFNISPDGLAVTFVLAPGLKQEVMIPTAVMQEIMKKWRDLLREQAGMRELAMDVIRTKH